MIPIPFTEIINRLKSIELPSIDFVVGIATGGTVPACLVAYENNLPFSLIHLNYRDENNRPKYPHPHLLAQQTIPITAEKILLVDDVSVSGSTLDMARSLLSDYDIVTLVLKGKADFVIFPEVATCVQWPWKLY